MPYLHQQGPAMYRQHTAAPSWRPPAERLSRAMASLQATRCVPPPIQPALHAAHPDESTVTCSPCCLLRMKLTPRDCPALPLVTGMHAPQWRLQHSLSVCCTASGDKPTGSAERPCNACCLICNSEFGALAAGQGRCLWHTHRRGTGSSSRPHHSYSGPPSLPCKSPLLQHVRPLLSLMSL